MSGPSVAILCQAGPGIGLGHLRRCLTLAEALRRRGGRVRFLVNAEAGTLSLVGRHGFPAHPFGTIAESLETLASDPKREPDGLVIDLLDLPPPLAAAARTRVGALAFITETAHPFTDADLIVDSRFLAEEEGARPAGTVCLYGPRYALLRDEFSEDPARSVSGVVRRVLVTMGGADPCGLTARAMQVAWRVPGDVSLDVVVGPFIQDPSGLEALAAARPGRARLHRHPEEMHKLMLGADLAISAGGQTLFELAATATPTVGIEVAPNQAPNLRALAARGALRLAGKTSDPALEGALGDALGVMRDPGVRAEMGARGRAAVDGRGTARVADAMLEVFGRRRSRTEVRR